MPRFGEIDYTGLEQVRRLLSGATEAYSQNKATEIQLQRELVKHQEAQMQRKAIADIVNQTAEAIRPKKVTRQKPLGAEHHADEFGLTKGESTEVPLDPREKNRIIDEATLRMYGIPGGEKIADQFYRMREPLQKPELLRQKLDYVVQDGKRIPVLFNVMGYYDTQGQEHITGMPTAFRGGTGLSLAEQIYKATSTSAPEREDLYVRDESGMPIGHREDAKTSDIGLERRRISDDLRQLENESQDITNKLGIANSFPEVYSGESLASLKEQQKRYDTQRELLMAEQEALKKPIKRGESTTGKKEGIPGFGKKK